MFTFIAETFVPINQPEPVADSVYDRFCQYYGEKCLCGTDRIIIFDEGRVILRPAYIGLEMRLEAKHTLVFAGASVILEALLNEQSEPILYSLKWYPAGTTPFAQPGRPGFETIRHRVTADAWYHRRISS